MKLASKTSGVSLHFEKHKANTANINGLQRHNERTDGANHSNKNIKPERTAENVMLKQSDGTYQRQVEQIIETQRDGGLKGVRKDAVRMVEATVQLSGQVLDRDEAEQERVLRQSYDWLKDTFGEENIVSAAIHKDETNMHLHVDFVPMLEGKLNAKKVLSKQNLQAYQNDFLKTLKNSEPSMNFVRGSGEYNGLPQEVFERLQEERNDLLAEIEEREAELNAREAELDTRKAVLTGEAKANRADRARLDKRESTVSRREMAVSERSNELDERESGLDSREGHLDAREKRLDAREKSLLSLEHSLRKNNRIIK